MNEESNGYHLLDERIGALETRNQAQIAGMCMTAFLALAGALLLALEAGKYDSGGTGRSCRCFGVYCRAEF